MSKPRTIPYSNRTFRFGNYVYPGDLPGADKLDPTQLREVIEFFRRRGEVMSVEDFKAKSFKPRPAEESRFSDGSYGVYYSAIEKDTAELEAYDTFQKIAAGKSPTVCIYLCFAFRFDGKVLDVSKHARSKPYLVDRASYEKCIALAKSARESGRDALLAPSAAQYVRSQKGTCLPVFKEQCLTSGVEEGSAAFTYPPVTD